MASDTKTDREERPNKLRMAKLAQIEALRAEANDRLREISDREFLIAGLALYAAEGNKRDGEVAFANTNPSMSQCLLCLQQNPPTNNGNGRCIAILANPFRGSSIGRAPDC